MQQLSQALAARISAELAAATTPVTIPTVQFSMIQIMEEDVRGNIAIVTVEFTRQHVERRQRQKLGRDHRRRRLVERRGSRRCGSNLRRRHRHVLDGCQETTLRGCVECLQLGLFDDPERESSQQSSAVAQGPDPEEGAASPPPPPPPLLRRDRAVPVPPPALTGSYYARVRGAAFEAGYAATLTGRRGASQTRPERDPGGPGGRSERRRRESRSK